MRILILSVVLMLGAACAAPEPRIDDVTITVIGTNDMHGELVAHPGRGGIPTFSGYVSAVRQARVTDGALLLVDAGDMWQGTLESNLNEGYTVVQAYNAMGYAASTIGNHEFDFGPVGPRTIPESADDDPRGALRARASEAEFPFLAANLIDDATGGRVSWDNVYPSTIAQRAGVQIGIIGVLTEQTPETTIWANIDGLSISPLADAIEEQARALRDEGAVLVVVVAHAGSECTDFSDPFDTASCDMSGEIMQVAEQLPQGLVDHIVAGHEHRGIAHDVNGIAITAAWSNTRAFSRVDFTIDRATGAVIDRKIYPPQSICLKAPDPAGQCSFDAVESREGARYEGRRVEPMSEVAVIAERAADMVARHKAETLGVHLDMPIPHRNRPESALGNLFTDAVLQENDADISLHNVWGGIRAELPQGELTYGDVFRIFPFDNRVSIVELSGAELRRIIAVQAHNPGRAVGFSGMRVFVACEGEDMSVRMLRPDGSEIADADILRVVANDFLLLGGDGIFTPVMPDGGFPMPQGAPLVRDTLVEWFRDHGGRLSAGDFYDAQALRWNLPESVPDSCVLSGS